jgi:SAM-dependent methyltransferase
MRTPGRWWDERVVPRLVERSLDDRLAGPWREQVCGGATGRVLELGFGSGRTLRHYPGAVTEVLAVDPSVLAWEMAADRVTASGCRVQRVASDAASLPLPDAGVDTVVSTWTMCTIPDLDAALAEARRVLRPGGTLRFVEHALAPSRPMATLQRTIQPVWGRVAGGCHVDRDVLGRVRAAGFAVTTTHEGFLDGVASPAGWFVVGTGVPG